MAKLQVSDIGKVFGEDYELTVANIAEIWERSEFDPSLVQGIREVLITMHQDSFPWMIGVTTDNLGKKIMADVEALVSWDE